MTERVESELTVGSVKDPAEAAADRMADVVVRRLATTPGPVGVPGSLGDASGWTSSATRSLFAAPADADTGVGRVHRATLPADRASSPSRSRIRRSAAASAFAGPEGGVVDAGTAGRIRRASGRGTPIDDHVRAPIEAAFGVDFGDVSVHRDSPLPAEVGAVAFAHGRDVHFAPGQYQPDTTAGLHTLSHELAHVVQQGASPAPLSRLHRLMSGEQFKESAKESWYQTHGKTMTEIDSVLAKYDALKARSGHTQPGAAGIDQAISLLTALCENIIFWKKSHAQDSGRQKQRAALEKLDVEARAELKTMILTREDYEKAGLTGKLKMEDNKFLQKMEGSASSIFDKLSPIIAAAVPSPGDGAKLELTVKIPVDASSSSYVGFALKIDIQRADRSTTKIGLTAAVNGGVRVMGVADVGVELGAFIEAQGKDPKAALQMISWGWYRRFRESVLPREIASFMWGGSTGAVGWARSEQWAANVEKNFEFDDKNPLSSGVGSDSTTNAYVRTGGYGSASASGTIKGIAEMEGSVGLSGGTHYDRDTINARKGRRGGALGTPEKMPTRGTTQYLGTRFLKIEAALGASVGPFSGSLSGAVELLTDPKTKKMRAEYVSASLSAGATVPLGATMANKLAEGIIKLAPTAMNLMKALATKASSTDTSGTPENVGQLVATGESLATAFGAFPSEAFDFTDFSIADEGSKTLAEQLKTGASLGEAASTMSLDIAIGKSLWESKTPVAIDITLNSEQGIQLDASIVALKATRSRRLLRLRLESGKKWKAAVD